MKPMTRQGMVRRASNNEEKPGTSKTRRSRRGDFNILWLIVTLVGIVIAVVIYYFVYGGASRVLGTTSAPAITASAMSGVLVINIKDTGVGNLAIYGVILSTQTGTATCSTTNYYLDGQSYTPPSSGPWVTLKPGQTFTAVYSNCNPSTDQVTSVSVTTNVGTYPASVT